MTLNEAETRRQLIDRQLLLAGWDINDPSQVIQELDIYIAKGLYPSAAESREPYRGHRFADYALLKEGRPIAVIEAKRTSKDAALGKEQALQYAKQLQGIHGGRIPFVFYTNGFETYFWESDFYPPVRVHGYPTRDDISWLDLRRESRRPLSTELINRDIAGRYYQIEAIRTLLERIEGKHREALLVMATGTGKTRTATALFDVLIRSRWAKRILFLVDRIALRNQALDAFKEHVPSEPRWPASFREKKFEQNRRIYVTTYPTMLNLIQNGTTPESWISPYFFDLIIADESHRSIYNTYKQVIQYFSGIKLGLTATPRDHIDHDTFKLFNCDPGMPTYGYSYEEAVEHDPPYLCDFKVLNVRSKFQIQGIHGHELPQSVQRKLIAEGRDLDEIDYEGTDFERKVSNAGTNTRIIREFMDECIKDATGTLPGKTIFFAITKAHARRLQDLFDTLYPEHAGRLSKVIVSDDPRVHGKGGLMDQFRNADMPRVAISVDMLDTGVDIREVVNLVFAKPVYSYVKFWQMIGRGTRVLEEDPRQRKPWCREKDEFLIIDCWDNFRYFEMHPQGKDESRQIPMPVRLFKTRIEKVRLASAIDRPDIVTSVTGKLRATIDSLPQNNVLVIENKAHLFKVESDQFWNTLDDSKLMYLHSTIAPIMRAISSIDFKAMLFEMEVVDLSTAFHANSIEIFESIRESIVSQAKSLPLSVNVVAKERAFISEVTSQAWWDAPSETKLDELVERLAPLMKFMQETRNPITLLDITDITEVKEWIEFGPEHERLSIAAYREQVEAYIRSLIDENPIIQKIHTGTPVTEEEISELAAILENQDNRITKADLMQAYDQKTANFEQLMRHILGLETLQSWSVKVNSGFDEFISEHSTLTSLQIRFLHTLRNFIIQTGRLEKKDLIQAPFTRLHPMGIRGVFDREQIEELMTLAEVLTA